MTGIVTEEDVRAAQATLDEWVNGDRLGPRGVLQRDLLNLRGLLAGQFANVRAAGYLEGIQRGRQEAAHVVLDALRDEGLAPMTPSRSRDLER